MEHSINGEKKLVGPVISNLPLAIIVVNKDRRVMLSNKAAEFISGKTEGEMFNLRGGDVLGCAYANDDINGCGYGSECQGCQIRRAVLDAFKEKTNKTLLDANLILQEYGKRYLKISATYLDIESIERDLIDLERRRSRGRRQSDIDKELVIVSIEDVTEFKKKEKLEAVIETVGAACHELNNPLQGLVGYLQLIELKIINNNIDRDKILKYINETNVIIDRMKSVVANLMELKEYHTKPYLDGKILDVEKSNGVDS